jgi:hypothetical protein
VILPFSAFSPFSPTGAAMNEVQNCICIGWNKTPERGERQTALCRAALPSAFIARAVNHAAAPLGGDVDRQFSAIGSIYNVVAPRSVTQTPGTTPGYCSRWRMACGSHARAAFAVFT